MPLLPYLHKLMNREALSSTEAREAMAVILRGEATTPQITAMLAALRVKGETADELKGFAQAMRDSSVKVEHGVKGEPVLDTCGTGGDGQGTLNVSTIVAFVVAAAGVKVAKHGNRSMSSLCGSADLLEELGARILTDPRLIGRMIREIGIGFLYAPVLHPAMRHAMPARAELKCRTAFNLLGPLTNPANANVQLVGAPSPAAAELMAMTLSQLGLERGYVVHGSGGLDEVSTTGESTLLAIVHGALQQSTVTPEEFGVRRATLSELRGGDRATNAQIARAVLSAEKGAYRDIVLVNSAVALMAAGKAGDYRYGVALAAETIDAGLASRKLAEFIEVTNELERAA